MGENGKFWYLENIDLQEMLCPNRLKDIRNSEHSSSFNKNEFIYFQEDPANLVYLISSGRVKIGSYTENGEEIVKAILSSGELFGEMALTGEEKRAEFAQAMDNNTTVCSMSIDMLKSLMAENKELSFKIYKLIGMRIRRLEKKIESLVFKDARTRIIEFLRDTALGHGKKVGFETLIPTKFTHKDIASLTGTSRQTVTTILNELREDNIINFDRRKILIRDLEKLH